MAFATEPGGAGGPEQEAEDGGGGRVCLASGGLRPSHPRHSLCRFPRKVLADMEAQVHKLREELVSVNSQRKQQLVELGLLREEEKQRAARDHEAAVSKLKAESEKMRLELKKTHAAETELTLEKVGGRAVGGGLARAGPRPPPCLPGSPLRGGLEPSPQFISLAGAWCARLRLLQLAPASRGGTDGAPLPSDQRRVCCRASHWAGVCGLGVEWRPWTGLGFAPVSRGGWGWVPADGSLSRPTEGRAGRRETSSTTRELGREVTVLGWPGARRVVTSPVPLGPRCPQRGSGFASGSDVSGRRGTEGAL